MMGFIKAVVGFALAALVVRVAVALLVSAVV